MSDRVERLLALIEEKKVASGDDLLELSLARIQDDIELARQDALNFGDEYEDLDDVELGRLNWSPRVNWVEREGGLPRYIEKVAIGIMKGTGYPRERAIPIAISRIKVWARGGAGVNADTVAKAIAALAAWEKLKAKAAARRARK